MKKITNKLLLGLFCVFMVADLSAQETIRLLASKKDASYSSSPEPGSDKWDEFWSFKFDTFLGAYYSKEIEIDEGEVLRPLQMQYLSFAGRPYENWEVNNNRSYGGEDWGLKVALQFKIPEYDGWLNLLHDKNDDSWSGVNSKKPLIYGPAKVRLAFHPVINLRSDDWDVPNSRNRTNKTDVRTDKQIQAGVAWCLLEKTKNWGNLDKDNNIIVMPNTSSDMNLIVEGSDDLVNWTRDQSGDKPAGNRKRFYRLRAVKK
tara:strand:- start:416 stop:1192 length:777 start_codon:yes stop_codon:yes gene_type:complete